MKKYKIIVLCILSLFAVYIIYEVNRSSKIPDHIHSIDDKPDAERNDDDKIIVLERSLQKEPDNVSIMQQLAELYLKTSQVSKAKRITERILEIDPANEPAMERLKTIKSL
jgi:DNA-binding SARP family transcriptional activator